LAADDSQSQSIMKQAFTRMLMRAVGDSERSTATILVSVSSVAIGAMGLLRWRNGEYAHAWADFGVVALIILGLIWLWRGRSPRAALIGFSATNSAVCAVVAHIYGSDCLGWVYLVLITNFFVAPPKFALGFGLLPWLVVGVSSAPFSGPIGRSSFVITALLVMLFSYLAAYRNQMQQQLLATQATHDPLTNAGNRRLLEQELERALAQHARGHGEFGLAIIDIDHFKQVNDSFGHAEGDAVLIALVKLIQGNLRGPDRTFRIGGEEFAVLFPDTDPAMLALTLKRLHRLISGKLESPGGQLFVSVGGASLQKGESASSWLRRADIALYQAKNEGRNRLVMAS
jgi:diguanylate cyclase